MAGLLFSPLRLREVEIPNRIAVAPMCQYRAVEGMAQPWHMVHLGQFALGGAGLILVEATGVTPEGRITPGCLGLWSEAQAEALARIADFVHDESPARIGIQLAHAGRKASTAVPWEGGGQLDAWETLAPSPLPYLPDWTPPHQMDETGIQKLIADVAASARLARQAGFDLVEIHAAHGYLLHQFLSPLTNQRQDRYGGSLPNRMRLVLEVFSAVRAALPDGMPVILRLSATDWIEGGWTAEDSAILTAALKEAGCDMVHVSSGGLDQRQVIPTGPGYQVGLAARMRATGMPTMAVGQINDPHQAETILATGQADMVALARGMLWDPHWAWRAALALGATIPLPAPYARANPALRNTPFLKRT